MTALGYNKLCLVHFGIRYFGSMLYSVASSSPNEDVKLYLSYYSVGSGGIFIGGQSYYEGKHKLIFFFFGHKAKNCELRP